MHINNDNIPPFKPLRILTIPMWLSLHYLIAGLIMIRATPSPVILEVEQYTGGAIDHFSIGVVFWIYAILLLFDRHVTPRKLLLYFSGWGLYVWAVILVALKHFISGDPVPGVYLALNGYVFELIFMLMAYSVYQDVYNVAGYIASIENKMRRRLSRTDLREYDES